AAEKAVSDGFTALKLYPVSYGWDSDALDIQKIEDIVKAVRDAVGPCVDLMVDGGKLDVTHAIRVGRRLERYELFWLEEPIPPGNPDAMAYVARNVNIPIAGGENLWTKEEFK
ncbi:MAG: enolase C-terminal domain-like protein, partial [Candidatus Bathyarchaeia archaeon]